MADLPSAPPFTYCATDYFGPFIVRETRKELKRYRVIFTCMASRAVHLEIASLLETDSFLNTFRRFASRCGGATRAYRSFERDGPRKSEVKPLERTVRLDYFQNEHTVGKPHGRRVRAPDPNGTECALIPLLRQRQAI